MKSKKIVWTFIATSFLLVTYFVGTIVVYDPLKIFHKPWKYKQYLQQDMRQQAAGIINNWEYDSIILGTSILECTSSQEASKKLGGKFINISLSGSYFYERAIVLAYVLKKQSIKKVIYSLDNEGLVGVGKSDGTFSFDKWVYLYDTNPLNDIDAYINDKYIKCLFSTSNKLSCMGTKLDFDRPNTWHKIPEQAIRFGGLDNWFKSKGDVQIKYAFKEIADTIKKIEQGKVKKEKRIKYNRIKSQKYLNDTLLKYVKQYKNTEFIFILPPYSRIKFALDAQYNQGSFSRYKDSIRYLVSKSKDMRNLKIYGWGNHSFVDDIANYKDLLHYEYKVNSWILGAIQRKEGLLTPDTVNAYLKTFTQKALHYNLFALGKKIERYLSREK